MERGMLDSGEMCVQSLFAQGRPAAAASEPHVNVALSSSAGWGSQQHQA